MIANLAVGHLIEQFLCTRNFGLLDWTEIQTFHRSLCFGNKEYVLHCPLIESNRPVGRVIADRSWNVEALRQFCIYANFYSSIEILCEFTFDALLGGAICEYIILNRLFCSECFIKGLFALISSKNTTVNRNV